MENRKKNWKKLRYKASAYFTIKMKTKLNLEKKEKD
jgi:hypothetical protein